MQGAETGRLKIAVAGTGISGMAAAWLLSRRHDVTVYERNGRIGGHSHTVTVPGREGEVAVDTGFIVYNERTYPNLTALFDHLGVATAPSHMSFSVSLDGGAFEYAGNLAGLFAQKRNVVRTRLWSMLRDVARFYREAVADLEMVERSAMSLGAYLDARGYGEGFRRDHILPMAGAIWSAAPATLLDFPAATFIRFFDNHGLLQFRGRPQWRTVVGGSRSYVEKLTATFADRIRLRCGIANMVRQGGRVTIRDERGGSDVFDHVVIAAHADEALAMLDDASDAERELLGSFRYTRNRAVLHSDPAFMPRRRAAWASWNHIGAGDAAPGTVTYWMNRLQPLGDAAPLFVTLNPGRAPAGTLASDVYDHPVFDAEAVAAQRRLWSLQGQQNTWFAGAYFGAGFHEDGLQAGLAVAEQLGGVRRPWSVPAESGRIFVSADGVRGTDRMAA
jgi:predicted NAD/FAD-binding protein